MRSSLYALTLFVSAFLLFSVQPMLARFVLPLFGGGSGIWSVCLLFFQSALLFGYLYAHWLGTLRSIRIQVLLHGTLLLASLLLLPTIASSIASSISRDTANVEPQLEVLWVLAKTVGLPTLFISSSAPLLLHWFAQRPGPSPYRLYAISNLGSLLGLLCYPLLVEPFLGLARQAQAWSSGYLVFVALSLGCALWAARSVAAGPSGARGERAEAPLGERLPMWRTKLLWLALSCAGVVLLLSITTEITANLVPMPLLWVVPLSLYLITFIASFSTERSYRRKLWLSLFCFLILPTLWLPALKPVIGAWGSVLLSCLGLYSGCMICHGELALRKPPKRFLSNYYLFLALGGVIGSVFVNFAAPRLFSRYWELPIVLFAIFALAGISRADEAPSAERKNPLGLPIQAHSGLGSGVLLLWAVAGLALAYVGTLPLKAQDGTIAASRSFYGRLSVIDTITNGEKIRVLNHGSIRHGSQYLSVQKSHEPTAYFHEDSGIGLLLRSTTYSGSRKIGVIGLGVGTLAAYGKPGDVMRFYELDPMVVSFAQRYFSFLKDSAATIEVVVGDGRLSLERELAETGGNRFDILVADAFNADAVPIHLLTKEAFALYWRHLRAGGTLALQITNTFLDLAPVVRAQARALGKDTVLVHAFASDLEGSGSSWILVTSNLKLLQDQALRAASTPAPPLATAKPWTDDYSNILQALK